MSEQLPGLPWWAEMLAEMSGEDIVAWLADTYGDDIDGAPLVGGEVAGR